LFCFSTGIEFTKKLRINQEVWRFFNKNNGQNVGGVHDREQKILNPPPDFRTGGVARCVLRVER
jgi:hypothetical protein